MSDARGVLFPRRLPDLHRLPPSGRAADLATWFWIPEWRFEPGETSRQHVVAYPALNLVVEAAGVELVGASTTASYRDLTGHGWAVGALLRPAAVAALVESPAALLDDSEQRDLPDLHRAVSSAMAAPLPAAERRDRAVLAFSDWLVAELGDVTATGRHANTMADLLMASDVRTPEQAAARLAVSVRTLQRMAHRHVGLSPAAMIRRRRLQEAAERIRSGEAADLARIAADLGYTDHAHLTTDFRRVLGFTPSEYRAATSGH